jgi:hypothetical protein
MLERSLCLYSNLSRIVIRLLTSATPNIRSMYQGNSIRKYKLIVMY